MTNLGALPYYGGKQGYGKAEWIAGLLPWKLDSFYCEPFAGMAGVLLNRPAVKMEMLNDLNGRVVNWWRVVRNYPEDFGYLVEHTPRSRDEFRWAGVAVDNQELPDIQRALAFHILISQCLNTGDNRLTGGSWRRRFKPEGKKDGDFVPKLDCLAKRLRYVQLENINALDLLERTADCDYAVIYCDPPYPTADTGAYAIGNLDFDRLGELLQAQQGAVAVSGYPGEWDCLGWESETQKHGRSQINGKVQERTEVLWRNARCIEAATVRTLL